MDFTAMQARVRMLIDETTAGFWTDAQIKAEINDAQLVLARDTEEMITYHDIDSVDGENRISLPSDYLKMKFVEYEQTAGEEDFVKLQYLTQKQFFQYTEGATQTEGVPQVYKISLGAVDPQAHYPGEIFLYPTPDTSGLTVRLHFYQIPTELSASDDVSELPELAHKAVVYRAAADLLLKAKEYKLSDRLESKYEKELFAIRLSNNRLQRDSVAVPEDIMGYGRTQR
jgi:hypothetical protein